MPSPDIRRRHPAVRVRIMTAGERVVVIGAGAAGLTTAVVLAEAGASVHVIAEQVPGVTSLAAGAMWGPYLVEPKEKVDHWGQQSLEIFRELAEDPATGVRLTSGMEASRTAEAPPEVSRSRMPAQPR
jgi:D-amino-acid oxidase